MALRLRRGTDSERQLITPLEGELIYTTDTKTLYIGDGVTQGGLQVTGAFPESIDDLADVDISSISPTVGQVLTWNGEQFLPADTIGSGEQINADIIADDSTILIDSETQNFRGNTFTGAFIGDGSQLTNLPIATDGSGVIEGSNYRINIAADDSTIMVDTDTNTFTGNFVGDVQGSVLGLDSTVIIDSTENVVRTDRIFSNILSVFTENDGEFNFGGSRSQLRITDNSDRSTLRFNFEADEDLSVFDFSQGRIWFERTDPVNDSVITSFINGGTQRIAMGVDNNGTFSGIPFFRVTSSGIGFGNGDPTQALDIDGNAVVSGEVNAAAFKGTLVGDDSSIIIDAVNGEVLAPIRDIEVVGATDNGSSVADTTNPAEWLQITVNGNTRYIPLHV